MVSALAAGGDFPERNPVDETGASSPSAIRRGGEGDRCVEQRRPSHLGRCNLSDFGKEE